MPLSGLAQDHAGDRAEKIKMKFMWVSHMLSSQPQKRRLSVKTAASCSIHSSRKQGMLLPFKNITKRVPQSQQNAPGAPLFLQHFTKRPESMQLATKEQLVNTSPLSGSKYEGKQLTAASRALMVRTNALHV
jgi:hypothetical protein